MLIVSVTTNQERQMTNFFLSFVTKPRDRDQRSCDCLLLSYSSVFGRSTTYVDTRSYRICADIFVEIWNVQVQPVSFLTCNCSVRISQEQNIKLQSRSHQIEINIFLDIYHFWFWTVTTQDYSTSSELFQLLEESGGLNTENTASRGPLSKYDGINTFRSLLLSA